MELGWILSALMAFMMLAYGSTTVTIKKDGCGSKKLCNSEPAACDPAETTECWFGSVAYKDVSAGKDLLQIEVRGEQSEATGVALGLKLDAEDKAAYVFVCTPGETATAATVSVYGKTVAKDDEMAKDKTITITDAEKHLIVTADEVEVVKDAASKVIRCQFNVTMDKDVSKIAIFLGTGTAGGSVTVKMGLTAVYSVLPTGESTSTTESTPTTVESTPGAGAGLFPSHVFALLMAVLTVFIMNRA